MRTPWTRRQILKTATALATVAGVLPRSVLAGNGGFRWRNWGGNLEVAASAIHAPRSEDQLVELIKNLSGTLRPVGSGHSWSDLVPTEGTLLSLDAMHGLYSHDSDSLVRSQVFVREEFGDGLPTNCPV